MGKRYDAKGAPALDPSPISGSQLSKVVEALVILISSLRVPNWMNVLRLVKKLLNLKCIQFHKKITLGKKQSNIYCEKVLYPVDNNKPIVEILSSVTSNSLVDINILENHFDKMYKVGKLRFFETVFSNGIAKHYFLVCNTCNATTDIYTLPKHDIPSDGNKKVMFGHNLLQILGARLSGIGKGGIDTMNTILGLSSTLLGLSPIITGLN